MPDLDAARRALNDAAITLDQFILLAEPDVRNATGRYERVTNAYQAALVDTYQSWISNLTKSLESKNEQLQREAIAAAVPTLLSKLQLVAQDQIPLAVQAIAVAEYVPSPDAWRMIADAIEIAQSDLAMRFAPNVLAKLNRALDEGADVGAVAQSLLSQIASYAGSLWTTIQRLVGDFAAQAETRDDLIFPCRWVRDPRAKHCAACLEFGDREYESFDAMLQITRESVPGYFQTYAGQACWGNCRCHLELKINETWTRI